ncbi:MAG: hypothetical protein AB1451_05625 [Nitrospirota bacterium]
MTPHTLITVIATAGLITTAALTPALAAPSGQAPPAAQAPVTRDQPASKTKTKPRRVIIFGTTIVGDVLKPPIEKTVPWQRPAAFQSNAAPLAHDFLTELLTPLDRDAILQDAGDHAR